MDEQTGLVDVENNLVYRVSGAPIEFAEIPPFANQASTIRNNILAFGRSAMVNTFNPYPTGAVPSPFIQQMVATSKVFYFDRNLNSPSGFSVQGGCTYSGGQPYTAFQQWSGNLYWRADGTFSNDAQAFHVQPNPLKNALCGNAPNQFTFYTFAGWQRIGEDTLGVVQNPGFASPAYPADDYTLIKGPPLTGFVVFDPNQAGRTNPVLRPPAVAPTFPTQTFNPATDF